MSVEPWDIDHEEAYYEGKKITSSTNTSGQAIGQYSAACMEVYGADGMFGEEFTQKVPDVRNED